MGPKRIASLEKEAEDWRTKAEEAVASIQDITVTYFAQTSKALAGTSRCVDFLLFVYLDEFINEVYVSYLRTQEENMSCRVKLLTGIILL